MLSFLLSGCSSIPSGVQAVGNFDVNQYQGTWYEIARLDHIFERGLSNVSAKYTLRDDGGINVLNKGFDKNAGQWKQIEGKAYFVKDKTIGRLKVAFFGPFYGGYNIIALDRENYSYALVCGSNRSYLWILARQTTLDRRVMDQLITTAGGLGFETNRLIFVEHDRP